MNFPNFTITEPLAPRELTLTVSFFEDTSGAKLSERTCTWSELTDYIVHSPTYTHKKALPLITGCRFNGHTTVQGSKRAADFVTEVTLIEIDYDRGVMPVDEARDRLQAAGLQAVLYTTPSCHETDDKGQALGWRWRALVALAEPIPLDRRQYYVGQLNHIFDGQLARESFNRSQSFYIGRVRSVFWQTEQTTGVPIDVLDLTKHTPVNIPDSLLGQLVEVQDPREKDNAVGHFCRAFSAPEAMSKFLPHIFTHARHRRWSWAGHAHEGIWVHDLEQHVGGSHDSWPAGSNKLMNTFDLVRHFKFRDLDPGLDPATPAFKRPSYMAMLTWMATLPELKAQGFELNAPRSKITPMDFEVIDQQVEKLQAEGDQGYPTYSADDMRNRPEVKWLIKHVLPSKSISMIYGASGSGKSFLALDMALAIAGQGVVYSHYGHPVNPRRLNSGRVIYVVGEGFGGFGQRVEAYLTHFNINHNGIPKDQFAVVGATPNLGEPDDIARLRYTVKTQMGGQVDLLVIDTLAATSAGLDENSKEILQIFDVAQHLTAEFGCAVLLIHHTGKDADRGARGFSGIRAALDAEIAVTKVLDEDEKPHWFYTLTKQKDAKDGDRFGFALKSVDLGHDSDGDPKSSLVVEHLDRAVDLDQVKKAGGKKRTGLGALETAVLKSIEAAGPGNWITQKDLIDAVIKDHPDTVKASKNPAESIKSTVRKLLGRVDLGGQVDRDYDGKYPKFTFNPDVSVTNFDDES